MKMNYISRKKEKRRGKRGGEEIGQRDRIHDFIVMVKLLIIEK